MNIYQPLFLGKPYGSPVTGYRAALQRRRMVVEANCSRKPRPAVFRIVDTLHLSTCMDCNLWCSCRLRKVSHV